MDAPTREFVRQRAGFRCEYCHLPEAAVPLITFHVEHVIARQHLDAGEDDVENLALACDRCNAFKGTNLSTVDPDSGSKVDIFHPRQEAWMTHFEFDGAFILSHTAIGRGTARLLQMNAADRVELRESWLEFGGLD